MNEQIYVPLRILTLTESYRGIHELFRERRDLPLTLSGRVLQAKLAYVSQATLLRQQ